ncbi:hypothetical protein OPIT5_06570 [Opitutaceae bacterium TAV5]|nr:hypothetical protein OPIT5_06570 [Opitutaceae bacterium TAV5]
MIDPYFMIYKRMNHSIRHLFFFCCWLLIFPAPFSIAQKSPDDPTWEAKNFDNRDQGGLAVRPRDRSEVVDGRLRISGNEKKTNVGVERLFNVPPYPTDLEVVIQPSPDWDGRIMLRVEDLASHAYVAILIRPSKEYAWTSGDDGRWNDWKRYIKAPISSDATVRVQFVKTTPESFRLLVNGQTLAGNVPVKNLNSVNKLSLTAGISGHFDIVSARASSDAPLTPKVSNLKRVGVDLVPGAVRAANPNANGYQIAYFERGYSDGMTDPARRAELVSTLRSLNPSSLRFPGGSWVYWYSDISPKSIAAFAKMDKAPYFARGPRAAEYRWSNDDYFLGICKELGVTAIYQLNIGTWYDAATDRAYKLAPFDRRVKDSSLSAEQIAQSLDGGADAIDIAPEMKDVDASFMSAATAHAARLALKARALGIDVLWEFGNEDRSKFRPATYVRQCRSFYDAIRAVTPDARFAFCADGDTWRDHSWADAVFAELVKNGMGDMAEASTHMYLTGGGGGPRDTGENLYKATIAAWGNLRQMHNSWRRRLAEAGLVNTRLSLTEYNITQGGKRGITGIPLEHSMGRALGEAAVWPELITRFNHIVFHDLIRNGYGHGTWFARIYYMADNPEGHRYVLPLDGKVMAVMHRHATGQILHADHAVVVSQRPDSLLVSVANESGVGQTHEIRLNGLEGRLRSGDAETVRWKTLAAPSLGTPEHVEFGSAATLAQNTLTVRAPGYSFSHLTLPLN